MVPQGTVLNLQHSKELERGDYVHVTFAMNHAGYWKFGSEESLTVIEKTPDGRVRFAAEDGTLIPDNENPPIGGTREVMLNELRSLSNFKDIQVIRPMKDAPVPEETEVLANAQAQAIPSIFPTGPIVLGLSLLGAALYFGRQKDKRD
jgi:hypothetical protein